jgi:hypothetical protein
VYNAASSSLSVNCGVGGSLIQKQIIRVIQLTIIYVNNEVNNFNYRTYMIARMEERPNLFSEKNLFGKENQIWKLSRRFICLGVHI